MESFEQAKQNTESEYFDFTINKSIKGNKLFEEITRDIPYFATFKKGQFELINLKDEYSEDDYNNSTLISLAVSNLVKSRTPNSFAFIFIRYHSLWKKEF